MNPIDAYIAAQSEAVQPALKRVRAIIRKAIPGAEELISYKIPAYKLNGRIILFFAGWKEHYSLYAAGADITAAIGNDPAPHKITKGTVRFPIIAPVPVKLIERIAKFRAQQVKAVSAQPSAPRRPRAARTP